MHDIQWAELSNTVVSELVSNVRLSVFWAAARECLFVVLQNQSFLRKWINSAYFRVFPQNLSLLNIAEFRLVSISEFRVPSKCFGFGLDPDSIGSTGNPDPDQNCAPEKEKKKKFLVIPGHPNITHLSLAKAEKWGYLHTLCVLQYCEISSYCVYKTSWLSLVNCHYEVNLNWNRAFLLGLERRYRCCCLGLQRKVSFCIFANIFVKIKFRKKCFFVYFLAG